MCWLRRHAGLSREDRFSRATSSAGARIPTIHNGVLTLGKIFFLWLSAANPRVLLWTPQVRHTDAFSGRIFQCTPERAALQGRGPDLSRMQFGVHYHLILFQYWSGRNSSIRGVVKLFFESPPLNFTPPPYTRIALKCHWYEIPVYNPFCQIW